MCMTLLLPVIFSSCRPSPPYSCAHASNAVCGAFFIASRFPDNGSVGGRAYMGTSSLNKLAIPAKTAAMADFLAAGASTAAEEDDGWRGALGFASVPAAWTTTTRREREHRAPPPKVFTFVTGASIVLFPVVGSLRLLGLSLLHAAVAAHNGTYVMEVDDAIPTMHNGVASRRSKWWSGEESRVSRRGKNDACC